MFPIIVREINKKKTTQTSPNFLRPNDTLVDGIGEKGKSITGSSSHSSYIKMHSLCIKCHNSYEYVMLVFHFEPGTVIINELQQCVRIIID